MSGLLILSLLLINLILFSQTRLIYLIRSRLYFRQLGSIFAYGAVIYYLDIHTNVQMSISGGNGRFSCATSQHSSIRMNLRPVSSGLKPTPAR